MIRLATTVPSLAMVTLASTVASSLEASSGATQALVKTAPHPRTVTRHTKDRRRPAQTHRQRSCAEPVPDLMSPTARSKRAQQPGSSSPTRSRACLSSAEVSFDVGLAFGFLTTGVSADLRPSSCRLRVFGHFQRIGSSGFGGAASLTAVSVWRLQAAAEPASADRRGTAWSRPGRRWPVGVWIPAAGRRRVNQDMRNERNRLHITLLGLGRQKRRANHQDQRQQQMQAAEATKHFLYKRLIGVPAVGSAKSSA